MITRLVLNALLPLSLVFCFRRLAISLIIPALIQHPPPTDATAKLLYARAFRCAYLNCREPLYREDVLSGKWVLNSRICHICARREKGPRWDPDQSAEDNRSQANLMLMCLKHAAVIDDLKAVLAYPAALLRQWKAAQIDDHEQRRAGWPLTNAMAAEALRASFSNVAVAISNSVVHLGGEGGGRQGLVAVEMAPSVWAHGAVEAATAVGFWILMAIRFQSKRWLHSIALWIRSGLLVPVGLVPARLGQVREAATVATEATSL